jgi:hypothetical protein
MESDWTNAYPSLPATLTRGDTYYIATGNYGGYGFNTAQSGTHTDHDQEGHGRRSRNGRRLEQQLRDRPGGLLG